MVVGPSAEVVIGAAVVDGCGATVVEVESGSRKSVGLVDEMSQNRAVMAKGVLVALVVLGLNGLPVELTALVVHGVVPVTVLGNSVTLRVDSGSTTSGLTVGGAVGEDGGPSAAEDGETVTGRVGSSGAGGDEIVFVLI